MSVSFDTDFVATYIAPAPQVANYEMSTSVGQTLYLDHAETWQAVRQTVLIETSQTDVLISAAVWFELSAFAFPDGSTPATRLARAVKLVVEEIDLAVVDLAGDLLRSMRSIPGYCDRCLAVNVDKPCTRCGRLGSRLNKTTDALVVAHAAILEKRRGLTTHYTLDGGQVHLGTGLLSRGYNVNVTLPPNPSGPLFSSITLIAAPANVPLPPTSPQFPPPPPAIPPSPSGKKTKP